MIMALVSLFFPTILFAETDSELNVEIKVVPSIIYSGQSALLSWKANDPDLISECSSDGEDKTTQMYLPGWAAINGQRSSTGSMNVSPRSTTRYSIYCKDKKGDSLKESIAELTVLIPVISFTSDKASVMEGEPANLSLKFENATHCTISGSLSKEITSEEVIQVFPKTGDVFTAQCFNDFGAATESKPLAIAVIKQVKSGSRQYKNGHTVFLYPASWGTLSDRSKEERSDGAKRYGKEYIKTMFPLTASNSSIRGVWYHKKTKSLVFIERKGKKDSLFVIKNNSLILADTLTNDSNANDCGQYGDILLSPKANLIFFETTGCIEGTDTKIFDLRTKKRMKMEEANFLIFSPQRDVIFSKDASRIAIRTEGSELMGVDASIYIQDPKTLKLIKAYSIKLSEYVPVYEKYGDEARLTLEDMRFNGNASLSFAKVVKDGAGKIMKRGVITVQFSK